MTKTEIFFKILDEGREYLKLILPALITWHCPQPKWMKKKDV